MSGAKGEKIRVRIHTQDHTQDDKSNSGKGSIVHTSQANSHTPPTNSFWTKNVGGAKVNSAHIPLKFNQADLKRISAAQSPLPAVGNSASSSSSFNFNVQSSNGQSGIGTGKGPGGFTS